MTNDDIQFFYKRMKTIHNYQTKSFLISKERDEYTTHFQKLWALISSRFHEGQTKTEDLVFEISIFPLRFNSQRKFFFSNRKVLAQVCRDVKDVLESMKRYEGTY